MKIQHIGGSTDRAGPPKAAKAADNQFERVLSGQIKADNTGGSDSAQLSHVSRWPVSSSIRQIKPCGLNALVKDLFSDTGAQILHEIELLCSDETGEGIDMKLLDDLLELYEEATGGKG